MNFGCTKALYDSKLFSINCKTKRAKQTSKVDLIVLLIYKQISVVDFCNTVSIDCLCINTFFPLSLDSMSCQTCCFCWPIIYFQCVFVTCASKVSNATYSLKPTLLLCLAVTTHTRFLQTSVEQPDIQFVSQFILTSFHCQHF